MSICYAVLVDGGFVKRKLGNMASPMDAPRFDAFVKMLCNHPALDSYRLHRVYYYDAAPLTDKERKPLGGNHMDFGATPSAKQNHSLQQQLPKLDNVALRMGELSFNGWKVKPNLLKATGPIQVDHEGLQPLIQQKGVDMRIGLDIAALTLKKIAQIIVLVSGDSDFVPAMKFARREGAQLYLVTLGHGVRDSMLDHADLKIDLPYRTLIPAPAPQAPKPPSA